MASTLVLGKFMLCFCKSKLDFSACCEPIISKLNAASPEQLMRSRFSAYVLKNYEYILASYASEFRKNLSIENLQESALNTTWLDLQVLDTTDNNTNGTVEFVATYSVDGEFFEMHELSNFIRQNDKWYYTDGVMKERNRQLKPNRNDECPCGSGKKFKKCCRA
jgi:SEC-C motif-containing protein